MMVGVIIIVLCIITAGIVYTVVKRSDTNVLNAELAQRDNDAIQQQKEYDTAAASAKLECDNNIKQINADNKAAVDKLNSDMATLKLDYENKLKMSSSDLSTTLTKEYTDKIKLLTDNYDKQIVALGIKYDNSVSDYELKISKLNAEYQSNIQKINLDNKSIVDKCNTALQQCDDEALQHKKDYELALANAKSTCDNSLQQLNMANKLVVDKLNSDMDALKISYESKLKLSASDLTSSLTNDYNDKIKTLTINYDKQIAALNSKYSDTVAEYELKIKNLTTDYNSKMNECNKKASELAMTYEGKLMQASMDCSTKIGQANTDCSTKLTKADNSLTDMTSKYNTCTINYDKLDAENKANRALIQEQLNTSMLYQTTLISYKMAPKGFTKIDVSTIKGGMNVIIVVNDMYVLAYNVEGDDTSLIKPLSNNIPFNSNFYVNRIYPNTMSPSYQVFNVLANDQNSLYGYSSFRPDGSMRHLPSWEEFNYANKLVFDGNTASYMNNNKYIPTVENDKLVFKSNTSNIANITFWSSPIVEYMRSLGSRVLNTNMMISSDVYITCNNGLMTSDDIPTIITSSLPTKPNFTIVNGKLYRAETNKQIQFGVNMTTLKLTAVGSGISSIYYDFRLGNNGELTLNDTGYQCMYVSGYFQFNKNILADGVSVQLWKYN